MIERMKMVHVVSSLSKKEEMLEGLRALGVMHLSEKKSAERSVSERFSTLSKTAMALKDYAPDKQKAQDEILSDEEFAKVYGDVLNAIEEKTNAAQAIGIASAEIDRILPWGEFSPAEVRDLKEKGYDFHFYRLGKNEYEEVKNAEDITVVRLMEVDKMNTVAVLGTLPQTISATEFTLPEKGIKELRQEIADSENKIAECADFLAKTSVYEKSFNAQMLKAKNEEILSSASETAENDEDFVWLCGYVPEVEIENFKAAASKNNWAWAVEDVAEDDDNIPTKMRYNKVTRLIEPLFDILGILPGYREQDVSLWFLMFFTVFVAMIIGDAAYGVLMLIGAIVFVAVTKKKGNAVFLVFLLSISTIVWGAITGTWFGLESAMNVPFLKALVIPNFANYPEYFGVTATVQQNTIMKFSFSIGAIQMELGTILAVKKKFHEKDLSLMADIGWMVAILAMYLLSLYLVIGENIPLVPIFVCIGVAFLTVVIFGGMSPDKTFAQGLKAGLANAFTEFLNTISCFGNVMSYIRLFAVGMSSLAIAQSFNDIAAGFSGPLIVLGIIVVLVGHGLNVVMALLSVVVHGVRLNVLEFSGIPYEPFKVNDKIKN